MRINRFTLSDSDSASLSFNGGASNSECRVEILAIENQPQTIVRKNGKIVCLENSRSIDDLKVSNLDVLRGLKLEYFPTNLTVKNGTIKRVYLGPPENMKKLSALLSE